MEIYSIQLHENLPSSKKATNSLSTTETYYLIYSFVYNNKNHNHLYKDGLAIFI